MSVLAVKDASNNAQNLLTNTSGGNQMVVNNIGDPTTGSAAGVTGGCMQVTEAAQAAGGNATPFFNDAVAGTVVQIKSSKGNLYMLDLVNTTAATAYLQIFYLPSASVNLGTTPASQTIRLLASTTKQLTFKPPVGASGTGLSIAGTTTATGLTGAAISVSATYA